jgi:hypothetical protein
VKCLLCVLTNFLKVLSCDTTHGVEPRRFIDLSLIITHFIAQTTEASDLPQNVFCTDQLNLYDARNFSIAVLNFHNLRLPVPFRFKINYERLHLNLLTYLLTPWCRIFFEKVIVTQLVKQ